MRSKQLEKVSALLPKLTFGLEVEQVGIGTRRGVAYAHHMNKAAGFDGDERWTNVKDGSVVEGGSEFVSGIMPFSKIDKIQEGVRFMKARGGRPHSSCGIHTHIDGRRFTENPQALIRLIKLVHKYESHLYHALRSGTSNRVRKWAKPVDKAFLSAVEALPKTCSIDDIKSAWYNTHDGPCGCHEFNHRNRCSTRYKGLNLHALWRLGTIEFRWFNATLHAGEVKAYIQLSALLCAYALTSTKGFSERRSFDPLKAKYEVRTMLVKIGAIGDEFKTLRFHMMKDLDGLSAFHCVASHIP